MRTKISALGVKIVITTHLLGTALFGAQIVEISEAQQKDLGVKCQEVTKVQSISFGPYNGVVVLDKKDVLTISSNVDSIVQDIYIRKLEYVKKGEKLVTLKSNALLSLQQEYLEALLESENINQNHQRNIKLQKDGIISEKKLLESQKLKRSSDLMVQSIANQLTTNSFTQEMLQELRKKHQPIVEKTIYASRNGIVNEVNVNIGENVSAEHKMIEIYADGSRFIELNIPVKVINDISIGDVCTFGEYSAKVSAIGSVVNSVSQSVALRATIEDAKDIMINRIFAVVIAKKISAAYKITKSALVFEENSAYIFKKVPQGFDAIEANIISEGPNCYIIEADLKDGDALAVSSTSALLSAKESKGE